MQLVYLRQRSGDLNEYTPCILKRQVSFMTAASAAKSVDTSKRMSARGFSTLYHKEMADHFRSVRFKLICLLLILTSAASLFGALSEISSSASAPLSAASTVYL